MMTTAREQALTRALAKMLRWATHGNKYGNPYGHTEVMYGLRILAEVKGISDPYDVDTEALSEARVPH